MSTEPHRLGRYVILGPLGEGGMGTVLDAFDPQLDRRVAIKLLHSELGQQYTARLMREAQHSSPSPTAVLLPVDPKASPVITLVVPWPSRAHLPSGFPLARSMR